MLQSAELKGDIIEMVNQELLRETKTVWGMGSEFVELVRPVNLISTQKLCEVFSHFVKISFVYLFFR